ncbi:putative ribonuclease H-like domain-containing protein [Tanacetum coccineum]
MYGNGDSEEEPAPTGETSALLAPKTAKQLAAKRNHERVKSILLLAIPNGYLLKFHIVTDAKSPWAAIKARFGVMKKMPGRIGILDGGGYVLTVEGWKEIHLSKIGKGKETRISKKKGSGGSRKMVASRLLIGSNDFEVVKNQVTMPLMAISSSCSFHVSSDNEISLSVFDVRTSDEESIPANDRFSKADGYHVVPPPITGNFLTPRADISFAGGCGCLRGKLLGSCVKAMDQSLRMNGREILVTGSCRGGFSGCLAYELAQSLSYNGGLCGFWEVIPKEGNITGFKLLDESQVVLKALRKDDVYSLDLKNIVPSGDKLGEEGEKRNIASQKAGKSQTTMADFNNMDDTINVSPIPTLIIHKNHPKDQILGDPKSAVQTRGKIQKASSVQQALVSYISKQNRTNHKDHQNCLLACFLSQEEPKNISQALQDESWVEAMQEELLQFKLQKVWILVDLPSGKKAIGTKWVFKNKRDERSIVVKNKARLVAQGAFLYGTIEEEVYVHQPPGFVDPAHPNKVYKRGTKDKTLFIKKKKSDIMLVQVYADDIIFYSTKKYMCTEFEDCMHKRFQISSMGELTFFFELQLKQQPDGIFISQEKYVADILKKFVFWSIRTATTPIESNKPQVKDEDGIDVDVHVYRYLKHQPKLGLWYHKDSPFELESYSDRDYGGVSLDRKSTTGGCQFLGRRLISWQCKEQTIMENSTTKAEYVAAANYCGQVLWIHNQMMDYGFNFMNTKIHIDNESTISVIKNPVSHSRTKHIKIRFHFSRDCYKKRLIEVIKIHTNCNVADLLTVGFDVTRFNFLVVSIGLLNL